MQTSDSLRRVRRAALDAMLAAGGTPRVPQLLRAGVVVRAVTLRPPARPSGGGRVAIRQPVRLAEGHAGALVTAFCKATGTAVPQRFWRKS